jgi:phosphohistidine swiveling domain-containing protein
MDLNQRVMQMLQKLKSISWDKRVTRAGFLQPKAILCEGVILPINLTKNVQIKSNHSAWIHNLNIYEDNNYETEFKAAFAEDKLWTLQLISVFDNLTNQKNNLIQNLSNHTLQNFLAYAELLKQIQKFYVIAVPLTNFCEKELKKANLQPQDFAIPIKPLDIHAFHQSKKPLKEFAWIKTFYNIVEPLKKEDLIKAEATHITTPQIPKTHNHLIHGLQVAIFVRNRIKELSQQLWFAVDPLAETLASQLNISKHDFFHLTVQEVVASLEINQTTISHDELEKRKNCFVVGKIDGNDLLMSGAKAQTIVDAFSEKKTSKEVKGTTASNGKAKGKVKVLLSLDDKKAFNRGDILVTTMTTPDFLPLMAKASAIITDEGGLSCHAAIVSRELNIPCIIGTGNATKVLKDNQHIEIDADKGIVTPL